MGLLMKIHAYLSFNGTCGEAFKIYENLLKGNITFLGTYAGSPMSGQVPPEWQNKVMHATLTVGDQVISGADQFGDHYRKPQGVSMTVDLEDTAEADRIFAGLSDGATIQMPIQETFWAKRFGMLTDRFGIPWMVNCGTPTVHA